MLTEDMIDPTMLVCLPRRVLFLVSVLFFPAFVAQLQAQEPPKTFTDPLVLLKAVARTYAEGADTFHMESTTETTQNSELHHDWRKTHLVAIKGSGNLYRIETRSWSGSFVQVSDGTNEWVYQIEGRIYTKHPVPQKWPGFSRYIFAGSEQLPQAWEMRRLLEMVASGYKQTTMLPEETIEIAGHTYSCYVVHAFRHGSDNTTSDVTLWIDKTALVFRKQISHANSFLYVERTITIPLLEDSTIVYPVTDLHPQISPAVFQFTPPAGTKEVAQLNPEEAVTSVPSGPKTTMVGQFAPDVLLTAADGKKTTLRSFRGRPVLLDLWATWCGPCLVSMPAFNRIYQDVSSKGIAVITIDQDQAAEDATEYLERHHYLWTNYHDVDRKVNQAFQAEGIPLTVLIDQQGKIVYYNFGGDEAALRKAIAALGSDSHL